MKTRETKSKNKWFNKFTILGLFSVLSFYPYVSEHSFSQALAEESSSQDLFQKPMKTIHQSLPAGVDYSEMTYGKDDHKGTYIVNVDFLNTRQEADALKEKLSSQGYPSTEKTIGERAQDDTGSGPLGYLVNTGSYSDKAQAQKIQTELAAKGYTHSKVVFSHEDGDPVSGPWVVHVLEVNPKKFKGHIIPALSNNIIPGRETVTSMSKREHAIGGINGGYFVMSSADGTEGDLAGISVQNGQLLSEAVNGRTSLILNKKNKASIASVRTSLHIQAKDGAKREIDGLNRQPGLIRGCGGVGDTETNLPKHDFTCTDPNELIQYSSRFGSKTPVGKGAEAVISKDGKVMDIRKSRGGSIPPNSTVLDGTDTAGAWILTHLHKGERVKINEKVYSDGQPLQLDQGTGIINGGPRLLKNGVVEIPATAEGFQQQDNPSFFYAFGIERHPRTLAGIKPDGTVLLVAIDGLKPGYSVGASFKESALIMKSLGASDAVNLDGGGSTTMTVNQKLVNHPSDATGERPVGDAILLTK